ncbi:hypothetical protein LguiA_014006 [Lonicera macranthoides]
MECVEGALKSSFRPQMVVVNNNVISDDFWGHNGQTGDDFFVDNLLDFSKACPDEEEEQKNEDGDGGSLTILPLPQPENYKNEPSSTNTLSLNHGSGSVPDSELCVPADDLADLEWLSNFVDDSFSGYSLTYPSGKLPENPPSNKSEPANPIQQKPCFTTPVQTKARTKRPRTGGRIWSLGSPPAITDSSASSSSSSSCTSSPLPAWLTYSDEPVHGKAPAKKQRRKLPTESSGAGAPQQSRRCSHCLVQKTPQWRTGPLGAKTLCNACGVRFKSGRLLPEYRPACSPTFSSQVHSNNHRKVLEMRRKKEVETGSGEPVQSF